MQKDPDVLVTAESIQKLDEELNRRLSYVIVRKGDTIIYESPQMDQPDIVKYLPDFGDADADLDGCTYLGGDIQSMIKQVDVTTSDGTEYSFEGRCDGYITNIKKGENGFGFDPIFYYPPLGKTFAELTDDEKNSVSHRSHAIAKLAQFLDK